MLNRVEQYGEWQHRRWFGQLPAGAIEGRRAKKEPPKMGGSFEKEEGLFSEAIRQADFGSMIETGFVLPFALKIRIRGR